MLRAHCVFLIQPTYGSGARKKPWAGRVHDGGRLRPRSANTGSQCGGKPRFVHSTPFFGIRYFANDSTPDFMARIERYGCGLCSFPIRRRYMPHKWWSCDLTPPDFFLWGLPTKKIVFYAKVFYNIWLLFCSPLVATLYVSDSAIHPIASLSLNMLSINQHSLMPLHRFKVRHRKTDEFLYK